jgi:hypothetical protein
MLERPRVGELEELEELWRLPSAAPPRRALARAYPWLCRAVVGGWAALLVALIALAPAADPAASSPLWAEATLTAWWLALTAAGFLGWKGLGGAALAASALAGSVGVVLGYACRATEHHLGAWWLVEAGACGALAALSLGCLALRRATRAT